MANTKAGGEKTWQLRFEQWSKDCGERHNWKYTYHKDRVRAGDRWKVRITCPTHGDFMQAPEKHKTGQGCPACAGNVSLDTLDRLRALYPAQVFPEDLPGRNKEKFTLVCDKHGEFTTTLNQLLCGTKSTLGVACHKCNIEARGKQSARSDWMDRLVATHLNYEFLNSGRLTSMSVVRYVCPEHGEQASKVADMVGSGSGCPECGAEARRKNAGLAVECSLAENVIGVTQASGGRVILHASSVRGTQRMAKATCVDHGPFEARLYSLKAGHGCPKCSHRISRAEIEIAEWLKSLGVEHSVQNKSTLEKGDIDILVGNVGIEYCGLYWHGEKFKNKGYHYAKYRDAGQGGVRLLTVFEDEWLRKKDVVKATVISLLGLNRDKVYARNTVARSAAWGEVSGMYEAHHLQGAGAPCSENYVLEHDGVVVAAMSFKPDRFGGYDRELVRFASSVRVVGGFSKLFKLFRANNAKGLRVVSYCDLRWFTGDTYKKVGFSYVGDTLPGYWWCKGSHRFSRFAFQKHRLAEKLKDFDPGMTEAENMERNGYWKIYDCGMGKWEIEL